jgi:hypothetical protein
VTESLSRTGAVERGRESYARRAWRDAYAQLLAADRETPLACDDLERLAITAYLVGRDADSADLWARAYHAFLGGDDREGAARCAFWLAFGLLNRGELARGGAWIARAHRVLEEVACDCVVQGYLLLPLAIRSMMEGNAAAAYSTFGRAADIGDPFFVCCRPGTPTAQSPMSCSSARRQSLAMSVIFLRNLICRAAQRPRRTPTNTSSSSGSYTELPYSVST